ncbi:helix-turn-helix domain-containing protein [Pseudoflavonifractor phocaeensis]|uniref:helix-turn-helix domain-containing protein n=1 Tax=Pseudoflavonifractor phocaeensis TaxID=1870988 RepID=UPI0025A3B21F|nr:helix-turn-helix domain-containing protein [Pseudoflavonifractor phocaeensis]MDM8239896.1 helix-turn-helix domain-containing protein [Pseudoflavonifractor phocaeensis]
MELKDRIALARKQAGLSQEQLGEKLGVSRQAVSKWESGQNNPDVAYLAEMCRLFGVSSDWLLLGQETEEASAPARCPDCQTIVTGLDNFCPNCGCSLKSSPKEQYALVLKSILSSPEDNSVLYHICDEGVYHPAFSLPENFSLDYTHRILGNAPRVLFRGLTLDQARAIQGRFFHPKNLLVCFDPTGDTPIPRLMDQPYKPSNKQGMSFWATVGAVVLGVICALLLLSIL